MSTPLPDLDLIIEKHRLEGRVEASAPIRFFVRVLAAAESLRKYERSGLGVWLAFPVEVKPLGEFIIAAPEHDAEAGSTVWFERNETLTDSVLAAALCVICGDRKILFATPEGNFVNPDFQTIRDYRQAETELKASETKNPDSNDPEVNNGEVTEVRRIRFSSGLSTKKVSRLTNEKGSSTGSSTAVSVQTVSAKEASVRAKKHKFRIFKAKAKPMEDRVSVLHEAGGLEWSISKLEPKSLRSM